MKFYQYNIRDLSDDNYIRYYSLMSEEKKRRVNRFRFEDDKKRTVVGEMLARMAISEWCGVSEESIVFAIAEHGKPYAKDLNVEFNISHSADMVVCVVDDNPVGVDIEKIRTIENIVIAYACNQTEKSKISNLSDKRYSVFFEIWTAKEAICKFEGIGVSNNLKAVNTKQYLLQTEHIENDNYIVTICFGKNNQNDI